MATLQEYKCPCCGGAIAFDSNVQKMKCPFCDTEFEMDALKAQDEAASAQQEDNIEWDTDSSEEWVGEDADGMRVYVCNSCGGEIICDETTAATSCPYCASPIVMKGNLSGALRPDLVIPFKLDKKAAKEALSNHLKGKRLLPKIFKDKNHIEEIKGIYVPFWLFDADVNANVTYRATRTTAWSDSKYNYTKTDHYSLFRSGNVGFCNVPVDGSEKMADDLMESIEPFNFSEAVDFQTAYLAGYLADKYDVDAQKSIERANSRIKHSTEEIFRRTVSGYQSVTADASNINISNGKAKYALLPVWILNTKWKDKKYTFAMNGQTGKFVGNLPTDMGAFWRLWAIWAAGLSIGAFAILALLLLL